MSKTHTRRNFLKIAGLGAAALATPISLRAAEGGRKPNIIYIMADDLGYRELGCFGRILRILRGNLEDSVAWEKPPDSP